MWFEAPTVSTHGALPGAVTPPYCVLPLGVAPEIAGRGDDGDPRLHGAPCRQREGIGEERLGGRGADRQVDHADVVLRTRLAIA